MTPASATAAPTLQDALAIVEIRVIDTITAAAESLDGAAAEEKFRPSIDRLRTSSIKASVRVGNALDEIRSCIRDLIEDTMQATNDITEDLIAAANAMPRTAKPLGVPAANQPVRPKIMVGQSPSARRQIPAEDLAEMLVSADKSATLAPAFLDDMAAFTGSTPEETPTVRIEPAIAALNRPDALIDAPTAADKLTEILTPKQVDALPEADLDERIRREVAEACPGFPMCPGFPHEVATAACSPGAPPSPLCGCGEWDCPECGKRSRPAKPRGKGKPPKARA